MEEETYTPAEAAKILGLTKRRVIQLITEGELEGDKDENGRWRIPRWSVHALRDERPPSPRTSPETREDAPERVRELEERVADLNYQLGRAEARAELTEKAESTLREERDRLVTELEEERAERHRLQLELEAAYERERLHRRSWWSRLFGR